MINQIEQEWERLQILDKRIDDMPCGDIKARLLAIRGNIKRALMMACNLAENDHIQAQDKAAKKLDYIDNQYNQILRTAE